MTEFASGLFTLLDHNADGVLSAKEVVNLLKINFQRCLAVVNLSYSTRQ